MKKLTWIFLLLAVSFLTIGCGSDNSDSGEITPLHIGLMPATTSIPMLVAQNMGYLPENVEIAIFRNPQDREAALHSGQVDGVYTDMIALLLNQDNDFPVYAISDAIESFGLVAHPDFGIYKVSDFFVWEVFTRNQ